MIVVLNGGRIEQHGPPLDLYSDPANVFVAGFIGTPEINLIHAYVMGSNAATADGITLPLPKALPEGKKIICGIRPQHILLASEGIEGIVTLVEPTGERQELVVRMGTQDLHVVVQGGPLVQAQNVVKLAIDTDKALLFDRTTGEHLRSAAGVQPARRRSSRRIDVGNPTTLSE